MIQKHLIREILIQIILIKYSLHLGIILILATFLLSSCTNPENDENLENNEVQVPVDETRPEETASEIISSMS